MKLSKNGPKSAEVRGTHLNLSIPSEVSRYGSTLLLCYFLPPPPIYHINHGQWVKSTTYKTSTYARMWYSVDWVSYCERSLAIKLGQRPISEVVIQWHPLLYDPWSSLKVCTPLIPWTHTPGPKQKRLIANSLQNEPSNVPNGNRSSQSPSVFSR